MRSITLEKLKGFRDGLLEQSISVDLHEFMPMDVCGTGALGKVDKPVMIKRGISGTLDELLLSAEYVFSAGNEKILLCERGIRTFETAYRNTFDINAIPILKDKSHLPVIADPFHGIGIRKFVAKIALASFAAGADGVIIEVHHEPEQALSDSQQTLNFEEFNHLIQQINLLKHALMV
jgi:3-deoxy-7-phosphoheptulonate synthase